LQRQVIYSTADVGAPKVESVSSAVSKLNPGIDVIEHRLRLDDENARKVITGYDVVAEGIDSFDGRYAINRACIALRKPLVSAAVGRFEAQLSVFKPFAGAGLPCYRCLAPEPPPRDAQVNCAEEGVMGPITGVIGAMAAMEVLKEILRIGETLAGRLFIYDGLTTTARTAKLSADPQCPDCGAIARG
jgi:adenylyltransferase/sulfurtransferase